MNPHKPGLIVHTFFVVTQGTGRGSEPEPLIPALSALWNGLAALGLTDPIRRHPTNLPSLSGPATDEVKLLAAKQRIVPGALYEALAYRRGDIVWVSVHLAPNDDEVGWQELSDRWEAAAPAVSGAELSTTTIYSGLSGESGVDRVEKRTGAPGRSARRLRRQVPGPSADPDWTPSWCHVADRLLLSDLPADASYGQRRHLLLAARTDEQVLDRFAWLSDGRSLPPLTRYLLYVAELQHQQDVLGAAVPRLREAVARTESACATLVDLLDSTEPSKRQLRAAALDLTVVQAQQGGLTSAWADASTMAGTVRGIGNNMEAVLVRDLRCRAGEPWERDRECAAWLSEQIRIELTYLDAAGQRAEQIGRLAAAVIDDRQQRQQDRLNLLQASIVSGLLTALAAIQSLGYHVPLAKPLVPPLICVLGILALVLPAAVLYWPRPGGPPPPRRWFGYGGLALGAAVGWFVASVGWWLAGAAATPPSWSVLLAATGAAVTTSVAVRLTRRSGS
ncbi:CATRA conflict system CASPASE/TPR repeat-associated protein [Micromonospora sp. NPDC049240]|uniref:CATRA conflict system CASPASE/TPR repeat-associated protein n=1 Tax=Micromonospora sp. NPDC049240 TaxID=3155151 RepID=UPI0033EC861A